MCILLIWYVRYEECVKIKQARLDWSRLLAACQYICRSSCLASNGWQREIYQYKHYHLSRFEWEDIVRYSVVIVLGSIINFFIF